MSLLTSTRSHHNESETINYWAVVKEASVRKEQKEHRKEEDCAKLSDHRKDTFSLIFLPHFRVLSLLCSEKGRPLFQRLGGNLWSFHHSLVPLGSLLFIIVSVVHVLFGFGYLPDVGWPSLKDTMSATIESIFLCSKSGPRRMH